MSREARGPAAVGAVVLAAGRSSRMGEGRNKLLEEIGGRPLVSRPVDALLECGVSPIVVVTGFEAERLQAALGARRVSFAHNPDWRRGMMGSIAVGTGALLEAAPRIGGALIVLGDLPRLTAADIRLLLDAFEAHPSRDEAERAIIAPVHAGRRGHPVLFGRQHLPALRDAAATTGPRGAREIIERNADRLELVEKASEGTTLDIDTPSDLERARRLPPNP